MAWHQCQDSKVHGAKYQSKNTAVLLLAEQKSLGLHKPKLQNLRKKIKEVSGRLALFII